MPFAAPDVALLLENASAGTSYAATELTCAFFSLYLLANIIHWSSVSSGRAINTFLLTQLRATSLSNLVSQCSSRIGKLQSMGQIWLPLVSVNKILLEQPWPLLYIAYGCFRAEMAELSSCDQDWSAKPKPFAAWVFTKIILWSLIMSVLLVPGNVGSVCDR